MIAARVSAITLFPVKGLRGLALPHAAIDRCGPHGDRRWMITDAGRRFLTQREVPGLACISATPTETGLLLRHGDSTCAVSWPGTDAAVEPVTVWRDQVRARLAPGAVHDWLSARLERECLLWFMHDTSERPIAADAGADDALSRPTVSFADGYPLLAVNRASLDALNAALGDGAVPIDRFRANLVIDGLPGWDENRWRVVRIGAMRFRAPTPCARCVVITRDQLTGLAPRPGEPLRTLARMNRLPEGIVFGANLVPETTGRLAVGDPVVVEQRIT